jgi:chitin disaccharide deacetylase
LPRDSGCDVSDAHHAVAAARALVVNGDDFGRTPGINRGVARAHEDGILTSASLMVRWPAATEAAAYCRDRPSLSLGLHLDLGEWRYGGGWWQTLYEVVPADDPEAVAAEVCRQLAAFRHLVGRQPTHVDSHQHVHLREPVRSVLMDAVGPLGIPTRACSPEPRYCGDFYGQTGKGEPCPESITVDALVRIIATLPAKITELSCHPGEGDDFDSVYRSERAKEVEVLCDPRVRAALAEHHVRLVSRP